MYWTTDGKEIRGGAGGGDDMYYLVVKVTLGADQSGCYTEVAPLHSNFQYIRFCLGDFI